MIEQIPLWRGTALSKDVQVITWRSSGAVLPQERKETWRWGSSLAIIHFLVHKYPVRFLPSDSFPKNSPTESINFIMNVYYEQTTLQCSHFYSSVHAWSKGTSVTLKSYGEKSYGYTQTLHLRLKRSLKATTEVSSDWSCKNSLLPVPTTLQKSMEWQHESEGPDICSNIIYWGAAVRFITLINALLQGMRIFLHGKEWFTPANDFGNKKIRYCILWKMLLTQNSKTYTKGNNLLLPKARRCIKIA